MRVCLIASSRHPIREPFAGGLESMTHLLARGLAARGHEVTLFAGPGSDPALPVRTLPLDTFEPSRAALSDRHAPGPAWIAEHHAYLGLMLSLARTGPDRFDVVHDNSLHHLPLAMSPAVDVPMVTTLHTPPLPLVESALALGPCPSAFVSVSAWTAASWAHAVPSRVVRNGLDLREWPVGAGGGPAVWSGRLVPEKAPHEAVRACRAAGLPLVLAGPVHDPDYFRSEVRPLLGDGVEYAGHLTRARLADLVGSASVAVVTPQWDEPYGLVAAEALACGTPVAGYARGGLPEFVTADAGVLVPAGDEEALVEAVRTAAALDRATVRRHAERACDVEATIDGYEWTYEQVVRRERVA